MTTKELQNKVSVRHANGYGQYKVTIEYRGKEYTCKSNNSLAWDRLTDRENCPSDNYVLYDYTVKQALQAFYDECKAANDLR